MTPHLSNETISGLLEGFLSPDERAEARAHVATCGDCALLLTRSGHGEAGRTFGRFVVLNEIGRGSVGRVMAAWDPLLNRKVALKVLRQGVLPIDKAQALLMREAQALARLTDPHVVAVYDAGVDQGTPYLAMELIEGTTFRDWLAQSPRSTSDIVHRFIEAADGLTAAHRVGLLHRDFKPSNLLVGTDGRLRVADFGLAGLARLEPGDGGQVVESAAPLPLNASLTETGALVGTPAYIAPEVWRGETPTHAADQFSFSVALFEALTATAPFTGQTVAERLSSMGQGASWPATPVVSKALKAIVTRGLAFEPSQRFESMAQVSAALKAIERRRTRRVGLAVAVAALVLTASVGGVLFERTRTRCADLASQLRDVWSDSTKAALLASSRSPALVAQLESWATGWVSARALTCREEASTGLPQRAQVACLEEQRRMVAALLEDLAHADEKTLLKAPEVVASLPPPSVCQPEGNAPAPAEPAANDSTYAAARSALLLGRLDDSQSRAEALLTRAQALGARHLEAAALELLAEVKYQRGAVAEAEKSLREALVKAEAAGANATASEAWGRLAYVVGVGAHRHEEGLALADLAGAVASARGTRAQQAEVEFTRAEILGEKGAFREALVQAGVAKRALIAVYGADDWRIGKAENVEGRVLIALGQYAEAADLLARAEGHLLRALPSNHRGLFVVRENRALALADVGRFEEAEKLLTRVLADERAAMPGHPDVAATQLSLGWLFETTDRFPEALEADLEAARLYEAALGPDDTSVARALNNAGNLKRELGDARGALPMHERALQIQKAMPVDHPEVGISLFFLAEAKRALGRCAEALEPYQRSLAITEQTLSHDAPDAAGRLMGLGECHLALGHPTLAIGPLERAIAVLEATPAAEAEHLTAARQALARARAAR